MDVVFLLKCMLGLYDLDMCNCLVRDDSSKLLTLLPRS